MSFIYKEKIANASNYGSARKTSDIKYITIHYTANDGDSDENNGKYFANNIVKASAHLFVDDDSVTQSVPDNYIAYSVGGNYGGGRLYKEATNANTLNIELCDTVKDGEIYPSQKTIENALELVKQKMKQYNIPASNVIRHYDVNGKKCPAYWVDDERWKSEFWNKLSSGTSSGDNLYRVRKTWADAASQLGAYAVLENAKAACKSGYSVFDSTGNVVYTLSGTASTATTYTGTFPALPPRGYYLKGDGYETLTNYKTQIKRIQQFLNWAVDGRLSVDGKYGPNTVAAVKVFQKKYGLTVDGSFGSKTLAKAKTVKK